MASRKSKPGDQMWGLGAILDLDAVTGASGVIPFPIGEAPQVPEEAIDQVRRAANATNAGELRHYAASGFVKAVREAGSNPRRNSQAEHMVSFWLMLMTQLTGWHYWALIALHTRAGDKCFLYEIRANSFDRAETEIKKGFRAILEVPIDDVTARLEEVVAEHVRH